MLTRIIKILAIATLVAFSALCLFVAYVVPIALGFSVGTLGLFCIICAAFVAFDDCDPLPVVTYSYPDGE